VWDRATDGPLRGNEWFVCETDRPRVPYRVTRNLCVGPIDRWSLFGVACDLFVGPIDRWYYIIHLWDRSTGGPVLYTSPPSLVRWTRGLHVANGPMGHTVHYPSNFRMKVLFMLEVLHNY